MIFSFMEGDWPVSSAQVVLSKILLLALPIMILVSLLILFFFLF